MYPAQRSVTYKPILHLCSVSANDSDSSDGNDDDLDDEDDDVVDEDGDYDDDDDDAFNVRATKYTQNDIPKAPGLSLRSVKKLSPAYLKQPNVSIY